MQAWCVARGFDPDKKIPDTAAQWMVSLLEQLQAGTLEALVSEQELAIWSSKWS